MLVLPVRAAAPVLVTGLLAALPVAAQPAPCFRSASFESARVVFAARLQKGDWETASAAVLGGLHRPNVDAPTRALYALQLAQAAQQRSSHFRADPDGVARLVADAESAVAAANDPCLTSDLQSLKAEIRYAQAFDDASLWDPVRRELDAILRGLEPLRDEARLTWALFYRGLVDQQQEVGDRGRQFFERASEIAVRRGDDYRLSYLERHLAAIDEERGDVASAGARFRRSLALREKVGAALFVPPAQTALADLLLKVSPDSPEVMRLYTAAAAGAAAAKSQRLAASAHGAISRRLAATGDRAGAIRHAEQALAFARAHGAPSLVSGAIGALEKLRAATR